MMKIGSVSKLLNLSSESIRSYEKLNIVEPVKEDNGYRYYDCYDLGILSACRIYRKFGFSLQETADFLLKENTSDIIGHLNEKEKETEEQIEKLCVLLQGIRGFRDGIRKADELCGHIELIKNEPLWILPVERIDDLENNGKLIEEAAYWYSCLPYVFQAFLVSDNGNQIRPSICANAEAVEFLGLKKSERVVVFDRKLCAHGAFYGSASELKLDDNLKPLHEYMHSRGLHGCGDMIMRINIQSAESAGNTALIDYYLPVE